MKCDNFFKERKTSYPYKVRCWDAYNAFHMTNGVFVEFESGELMITSVPNPDNRQYYAEYDVQLVTTTDPDCPTLYMDKECTEPVKKAWLTQHGQQHLVIDYERKVAFALQEGWHGLNKVKTFLGDHVESARAYWAGQERMPIPIETIKVQAPNPEYRKKMVNTLGEVRAAVTAIWRIKATESNSWWSSSAFPAKEEWLDSSVEDIVAEVSKWEDRLMYGIAESGFSYPRSTNEVEFLYVKERE